MPTNPVPTKQATRGENRPLPFSPNRRNHLPSPLCQGWCVASAWSYIRVAASLAFGLGLLVIAIRPALLVRPIGAAGLLGYGAWMIVVWIPSLVSTLGSAETVTFQIVHTVLAVVSLTSGAVIAGIGRRAAGYPITTSTQSAANNDAR